MRFNGWEDFADHLDGVALQLKAAPIEAAHVTAPVMADAVQEIFGHDPPLQTLAESTQTERVRLGYTPNDPLVRDGTLRESVEFEAIENIAGTGSSSFIAPIHEYGNAHIPPRPAFHLGFLSAYPYLQRIWKGIIGQAIGKLPK